MAVSEAERGTQGVDLRLFLCAQILTAAIVGGVPEVVDFFEVAIVSIWPGKAGVKRTDGFRVQRAGQAK